MGFFLIFAIAVAVGVMVFRLTGGGDEQAGPVEGPVEASPGTLTETSAGTPAAAPARIQVSAETQIPVVAARRSWSSRLSGALGLIVAIGVGAVTIAFTLYGLGSLLARLIEAGNR